MTPPEPDPSAQALVPAAKPGNGYGLFITLEGLEGAGKSTQTGRLATALKARCRAAVIPTREPGGVPGAEAIRHLLVTGASERWTPPTELLLMAAARAEHVARKVRPELSAGNWVLCDRFSDSTVAYQGAGHGLAMAVVDDVNAVATGGLVPDLTLILDLPVVEGLRRAKSRAGSETRFETMDIAFHERVRKAFRHVAEREPDRCRVIDATKPLEVVTQFCLKTVLDVAIERNWRGVG